MASVFIIAAITGQDTIKNKPHEHKTIKMQNPFYMQSEIFNGFILPTDSLHKCVSGLDV